MFGIENFIVFLTTGILLNLYPGPDSMYIIARSISQGRRAGIFALLGISSGSLFHTLIGSVGLSAIILSSAHAFQILKYVGASYLLLQAILMIKESNSQKNINSQTLHKKSLVKIYRQGALTNILNPKVALFFLALLPQFISPMSSNKPLSFIILGIVFIVTGTIWGLFLAIFASFFSDKLRNSTKISKWMLRANAGLFGYLGFKLATAQLDIHNSG